jgi:hypothetical protein
VFVDTPIKGHGALGILYYNKNSALKTRDIRRCRRGM